jgi:hypothetical protein
MQRSSLQLAMQTVVAFCQLPSVLTKATVAYYIT